MKNQLQKILLGLMLITTFGAAAQNNNLKSSRSVVINPTTTTQVYEIEVVGKVERLKIEVNCSIKSGEIVIDIVAPDGSQQGKFKAGGPYDQANLTKEGEDDVVEQGRLEKFVEYPKNGVWIVHVKPIKATGHLNIQTRQIFEE